MKITEELTDQLMVTAAHRYCLGRRSYIVGACIDFIYANWTQFSKQTQCVMIKDTIQAILDGHAGDNIDIHGWTKLTTWMFHQIIDENKMWVYESLRHNDKFIDWANKNLISDDISKINKEYDTKEL